MRRYSNVSKRGSSMLSRKLALSTLAVAAITSLGINSAMAELVVAPPLLPVGTPPAVNPSDPTLDYLHDEGEKYLDGTAISSEDIKTIEYIEIKLYDDNGNLAGTVYQVNDTENGILTLDEYKAALESDKLIILTKYDTIEDSLSSFLDSNGTTTLEEALATTNGVVFMDDPQKMHDAVGTNLNLPSILYPESGYVLKEPGTNDKTITKYEYDPKTNQTTSTEYKVELKQTEFVSGSTNETAYSPLDTGSVLDGFKLEVEYGDHSNIPTVITSDIEKIATDYANSYNVDGGGAIQVDYDVTVDNISGLFFANQASNGTSGGAILNYGSIKNLNGNFIRNGADYYGGAIYNWSQLGNLSGNFIENSADVGGALYNNGQIANLTATFALNHAYTDGGAIYNTNYRIGNLIGDFISNTAYELGGAVYNQSGSITNIVGDYIDNHASEAGAIANIHGKIGGITGDFIGNTADRVEDYIGGGAIANVGNESTIGSIIGDFSDNVVIGEYGAVGGAISNTEYANINSIHGNFTNNSAQIIYSPAPVSLDEDIPTTFMHTEYRAAGGAIYNADGGAINSITGSFVNNSAAIAPELSGNYSSTYAMGGAIFNSGDARIGTIDADFVNNSVVFGNDAAGGAIFNGSNAIINSIKGNFIGNYVKATDEYSYASGGAIANMGVIGSLKQPTYGSIAPVEHIDPVVVPGVISGLFKENYAEASREAQGGAIFYRDWDYSSPLNIVNSSFIGNYAKTTGEYGKAHGGAIYTTEDLTITAKDGYISEFTGNYVEENGVKRPEAIFLERGMLTLNAETGGKIVMDDMITGGGNLAVIVTGDETGEVVLNNYIVGTNRSEEESLDEVEESLPQPDEEIYPYRDIPLMLEKTTLRLGKYDNILDGNQLFLNSGTFSMVNNQVGVTKPLGLGLMATTNFVADVDLEKGEMDRIETENYQIQEGANLNVVGMNMLSDMEQGTDTKEIYFAQQGLKDAVTNGMAELPTSHQTSFYTPIYKYNAVYDNREDAGYFVFTRGDKIPVIVPDNGTTGGGTTNIPTGNPSDAFNPAVLGSSTTATAGALGTMNQTFNYAFQNADNFMNIPYLERIATKNANKYALSITGDATDVGTFSPLFTKQEQASVWVKPYASFETVGLKNGPKVHNNTYGTLVGFDSEMQHLKNGWDRVFTGYIGYNGASQRYSGVDSTQNGGLVGGTLTMYKGNFFNATTISAGANVAENKNMYGSEDFAMLLAGIGNKTGYNFEFKEGKYIIQPNMLMSYTFVNTFDYTNSAGVRIDNKPLHALQLAPGVKVIGNFKGGWQPYASVSMVWNVMGESDSTANGVKLPEMSIKPYVQYGVGLQKRFKDRCMAFGQAMIQNGGRNGISLTAGFRWALGKEGKPIEKVQNKRHLEAIAERSLTNNVPSLRGAKATLQSPTSSQGILRSTQNDKSVIARGNNCENSELISKFTPVAIHNKPQRKILKQLSPAQKVALTGKTNTSRTAKTGTLRQY